MKLLGYFLSVFSLTLINFGCSQMPNSPQNEEPDTSEVKVPDRVTESTPVDMSWLGYADPKADAYLAIEKGDLRVLAFAGRSVSFPGIELNDQESLKQQCDYRFLPNSGDALSSQKELDTRKKLFQYASAYNQIVLDACKKANN